MDIARLARTWLVLLFPPTGPCIGSKSLVSGGGQLDKVCSLDIRVREGSGLADQPLVRGHYVTRLLRNGHEEWKEGSL